MHAHPLLTDREARIVLLKAQAIATGGYFLDFTVDREAAARYGLRVQDVNDIIESAIGGNTIAMTVEGRERYPINVRYARDFRDDLDSLKRVLVPTPTGAQVPISMLAEISNKTGPPSIRNENAQLVGFVFVDITLATSAATLKSLPSASVNGCDSLPATTSSRQGSSSILRPPRNASRSSFPSTRNQADKRWLNRTVLGIELASFSSDWSRCPLSFGYCNGCMCHGLFLPDHRPPVTKAVRGSGNGDKTVEVAGPAAVIAAPSLRSFAQSIKVARMSRI